MRVYDMLPDGYRELLSIHLQKDKKLALLINAMALAVGIVLGVGMHLIVPIDTLFDMTNGVGQYLLRFGVLLVGVVGYLILHELVHGITMKHYGAKRVKYGWTGLYAFAGSDEYFDKRSYLTIALAPVVVWGIVLLFLQCFVSGGWIWVVWFIQITNLSGAAGDAYVTMKFSRLPADILVCDTGVGMTVYTKK